MHQGFRNIALGLVGLTAFTLGSGCQLASGMYESYLRSSTETIQAEWPGLKGKTIGVLVAIDPALHTRFPQMELYILGRVTERLVFVDKVEGKDPGATGFCPIDVALAYSANHPGWIAKPAKELSEGLGGVDCVVLVELDEFQLHDPGNMYTWDGVASGTVGVFDTTGPLPNEFAFRKAITVRFPDQKGQNSESMPGDMVSTELTRRFIDRAVWPFYTHEEPYYKKY